MLARGWDRRFQQLKAMRHTGCWVAGAAATRAAPGLLALAPSLPLTPAPACLPPAYLRSEHMGFPHPPPEAQEVAWKRLLEFLDKNLKS